VSTFGRRKWRRKSDLRQPPPASPAGAGWYVFEHLAELVLEDATALERMTPDQRLVYGVNLVRQEVASGGFEGYLDWTNASSVDNALAGFELLAPRLGAILQEALDLAQLHDEPDFDSLDADFTLVETQLTVDSVVDAYVIEHGTGFFISLISPTS
jgi:hypothetical protein